MRSGRPTSGMVGSTAWPCSTCRPTRSSASGSARPDVVRLLSSMLAAGEQMDLCYLDWDRFDVVTKDNSLVQRFAVDRHTGFVQDVEE